MKKMLLRAAVVMGVVSVTGTAFGFCPTNGEIEGGRVFLNDGVCVIQAERPIVVIDEKTGERKVTGKQATLISDFTFEAGRSYGLVGGFHVGDNSMRTVETMNERVKLTVEAGAKIIGSDSKSYIQIDRGGQIFSNGTLENPVVMTSAQPKGRRGGGQWGGLVINGNAPVSCLGAVSDTPCELEGEGFGVYNYGGPIVEDNSGVLTYTRVEYAGFAITDGNELNGIAFQGVGNGTKVSYIQVHANLDDGVEFFGGTVDVDHVVLTAIGDDSVDWTSGWNGTATNVIIHQVPVAWFSNGPYGIEGENANPNNATPRSQPIMKNFTVIGANLPTTKAGVQFKKGSGGYLQNSYVTNWDSSACLQVDGQETWRNALEGNEENEAAPGLTITNTVFGCASDKLVLSKDLDVKVIGLLDWFTTQSGNALGNIDLVDVASNKYGPVDAAQVALGEGEYIGAVKSAEDTWYLGWTNFDLN